MSGICFMYVIQLFQADIPGYKMSGNLGLVKYDKTFVYFYYMQRLVSQDFLSKI